MASKLLRQVLEAVRQRLAEHQLRPVELRWVQLGHFVRGLQFFPHVGKVFLDHVDELSAGFRPELRPTGFSEDRTVLELAN